MTSLLVSFFANNVLSRTIADQIPKMVRRVEYQVCVTTVFPLVHSIIPRTEPVLASIFLTALPITAGLKLSRLSALSEVPEGSWIANST